MISCVKSAKAVLTLWVRRGHRTPCSSFGHSRGRCGEVFDLHTDYPLNEADLD